MSPMFISKTMGPLKNKFKSSEDETMKSIKKEQVKIQQIMEE